MSGDLVETQPGFAGARTGLSPEFVTACVERWMEHEPLDQLPRCVWAGLIDLHAGPGTFGSVSYPTIPQKASSTHWAFAVCSTSSCALRRPTSVS
jgi:hypothetical protein